jgi:hypothetical protein
MQVFVPYPSPIDVAKCLDPKRIRKQIIECDQILAAINGKSQAWKNYPVVKMYKPYKSWLIRYRACLSELDPMWAKIWSRHADRVRPPFLTESFCDQHKRACTPRLRSCIRSSLSMALLTRTGMWLMESW